MVTPRASRTMQEWPVQQPLFILALTLPIHNQSHPISTLVSLAEFHYCPDHFNTYRREFILAQIHVLSYNVYLFQPKIPAGLRDACYIGIMYSLYRTPVSLEDCRGHVKDRCLLTEGNVGPRSTPLSSRALGSP